MKKLLNVIGMIGAFLMFPVMLLTAFLPREFMFLNYITFVCAIVFVYNATR